MGDYAGIGGGGYAAFGGVMPRFEKLCGVLRSYAAFEDFMRRLREVCWVW